MHISIDPKPKMIKIKRIKFDCLHAQTEAMSINNHKAIIIPTTTEE